MPLTSLSSLISPLASVPLNQLVLLAMLVFARVGACLMLMPGVSSIRIPVQVRLFIAVSFSLIILPMVADFFKDFGEKPDFALFVRALCAEMLIGVTFGVIAHVYLWALQFMATIIAMSMGYSGQPGHNVIDSTPETQVAHLLVLVGVMLFFASDLHMFAIRGLLASYDVVSPVFIPNPEAALIDYRDALSKAFLTTLRIAAPFIVYAVLVNIAVGLVNKLTPNIPVYFISLPFVVAGGLFLLYFIMPEILNFFSLESQDWLRRGP
ncbi:flagellar biosynthetic protein FliR [Bartonella bacilliformis str. Heidi Mejia]|uniref:flagellar biosynthesis protein FliR n=1 Tax=Bartonella bacilliformis TaxID=774 RepID=UPI00044CD48A|nr:flagellar biosynthesis protein FliR [Bartonella bacilliformis]EYS91028.1 flagellar biosynthetic protein FliR [Bartonella bacilliformis str. Heidi Mejia]KEG18151.1 flagellar biosynthetic protein FliR [Bartonella bacilliformis Hosp800-02]KEG21779.1 flagellar biosynthetic protein FliR [Bartonella bacilliformis VAB9028]KEG23154.1 flagellar biosynthetic protein FliR [Bartonella bacilliformis CAR600-02]